MKPRLWYVVLVLALAAITWSLPSEAGYIPITAWATLCGVVYSIAAVALARASVLALAAWAFLVTAAMPLATLMAIASPPTGITAKSVDELTRAAYALLPLRGFELALPALAAFVSGAIWRSLSRRDGHSAGPRA